MIVEKFKLETNQIIREQNLDTLLDKEIKSESWYTNFQGKNLVIVKINLSDKVQSTIIIGINNDSLVKIYGFRKGSIPVPHSYGPCAEKAEDILGVKIGIMEQSNNKKINFKTIRLVIYTILLILSFLLFLKYLDMSLNEHIMKSSNKVDNQKDSNSSSTHINKNINEKAKTPTTSSKDETPKNQNKFLFLTLLVCIIFSLLNIDFSHPLDLLIIFVYSITLFALSVLISTAIAFFRYLIKHNWYNYYFIIFILSLIIGSFITYSKN